MEQRFFLNDVMKVTGASQPKLQQWLREGYITASVPGEGSGTRNQFSFSDICVIVFFQKLLKNGYNRKEAGRISQFIQPAFSHSSVLNKYVLVVNDKDLIIHRNETDIKYILQQIKEWAEDGFETITLYSLKKIVETVKRELPK